MKILSIFSVVGLMIVAGGAQAVISTFDIDSEGWTSFNNGLEQVVWNANGGNPNGHISLGDNNDGWTYFKAPAAFTAQAAQYGGVLNFDLRTSSSVNQPNLYKVRVGLTGAGLILINESTIPTTSWQNYSFDLSVGTGWRVFNTLSQNYSNAAPLVTLTQMQSVLGSLDGVYIAADYNNLTIPAQDTTHLDNINLTTVPEPATMIAVTMGAAALLRRRKK